MRVCIAAVGRLRPHEGRPLLDDYYARIRRYATLDEMELKDDRADRVEAQFAKVLTGVGERGDLVVLDVQGKAFTSELFAARLGRDLDAARVPVFALGGAEGLPDSVRKRAAWKLSLGSMTLPHRLARIVLAEQVYRAFTILRGEPYAREG